MSVAAPRGAPHDVIVVGAGPGGSAAAYHLAARGARVLLLDKAVFPREKVCGDGLTPHAVAALDEMGVLEHLLPIGQPISGVAVTAPDGGGVAATVPAPASVVAGGSSVAARAGRPPMLVIARIDLDDAIRRHAVETGADFDGGVEVTDVVRNEDGITARAMREGRPATYRAHLAIVATGASIVLPKRLGVLSRRPAMMLAARTYVACRGPQGEGQSVPRIEIRFAGVPLPGYGWVFPISASTANVGVGFFVRRRGPVLTARAACERFLRALDGSASLRGGDPPADRLAADSPGTMSLKPIRSYPLRVDFPAAPVWTDGILFAGEAAGLVNPLTGEGIDYALESGRIAAHHAAAFLGSGDRSPRAFAAAAAAYERTLRNRFERLFTVCRVIRDVAARPALLNRLVRVAGRREDLTMALINIVLGNREPLAARSVRAALGRALLAR